MPLLRLKLRLAMARRALHIQIQLGQRIGGQRRVRQAGVRNTNRNCKSPAKLATRASYRAGLAHWQAAMNLLGGQHRTVGLPYLKRQVLPRSP